jgi:hypothetical protein
MEIQMPKKPQDQGDRLEQQYRRLRTRNPKCLTCGESDPRCLELHHVAGERNHEDTGIVCRNCHRKLSDEQHAHFYRSEIATERSPSAIGHYLLGLADFLLMIVNALREFGNLLLGHPHAAR